MTHYYAILKSYVRYGIQVSRRFRPDLFLAKAKAEKIGLTLAASRVNKAPWPQRGLFFMRLT
jgi:hypothetical protein